MSKTRQVILALFFYMSFVIGGVTLAIAISLLIVMDPLPALPFAIVSVASSMVAYNVSRLRKNAP
jgi:hypothetical protein